MIRRIGLVVHGGREQAAIAAAAVRTWAREHGIPCVEVDVWNAAPGDGRLHSAEEAARAGNPDLIVTIGGDGTFLRGVRVAMHADALVLGVSVGRVGFLTEVRPQDVVAALDAILAGDVEVEERLTLTMRASRPLSIPPDIKSYLKFGRGPMLPPPEPRLGTPEEVGWGVALDITALNDVVFEKLARDRLASLAVYVSGRHFASYSADALVVASPTGSTAYSFAAGGPVVSPGIDALIFTPVAPHMAFNRSILLDARRERVAVLVLERSGRVAVTVDGQLRGVLEPGDWVSVYAAPRSARLARVGDFDFLSRVRDRFGLADAAAALADGEAPAEYRPAEPIPPDLLNPGPWGYRAG
ncbi:MAG: NAD(+)/NADH kinase [Hamadaea sp.]|uniref:NAD(+)/NADH kinase n=1 Tax=Hamadaea sp. TaxID=2024425 RepID=UPI0018470A0A|nr:NAD(+)/NADH kinase [Hamadaea sp.]NUR71925.1 NAD(+)/NADH kinase [Hamadaea sp.]NUT18228.1 NAD(+)/NADH kinase [Hamadaea sp.]